jgi:hypothetical protein
MPGFLAGTMHETSYAVADAVALATAPIDWVSTLPGELFLGSQLQGEGRVLVVAAARLSGDLGPDVAGPVRDRQVAAGRDSVHQPGGDRPRGVFVRDERQAAEQHDRDRLAKVQGARSFGEDLPGIPGVRLDEGGGPFLGADQERPGNARA